MKTLERIRKVADLFAAPIAQIDGMVVLVDRAELERHEAHFKGDKTALEAFVNHVHLEDLVSGLRQPAGNARREALRLGELLIRVWSERVAGITGSDLALLFYLGGTEDVVVRFHVERANEHPWIAISKKEARSLKLRVYRLRGGEVTRLA